MLPLQNLDCALDIQSVLHDSTHTQFMIGSQVCIPYCMILSRVQCLWLCSWHSHCIAWFLWCGQCTWLGFLHSHWILWFLLSVQSLCLAPDIPTVLLLCFAFRVLFILCDSSKVRRVYVWAPDIPNALHDSSKLQRAYVWAPDIPTVLHDSSKAQRAYVWAPDTPTVLYDFSEV